MTEQPWTIGEGAVPRTGRSELADDELVICDAIFDGPTPLGLLLHEDFHLVFNFPYGAFKAVSAALVEAMTDRNLIRTEERGQAPETAVVCLTTEGAAAWALERRPVWDAYCRVGRFPRGANWVMRLEAASREVGRAYLEAFARARQLEPGAFDQAVWQEHNGIFPYWRPSSFVSTELPIGDTPFPEDQSILRRQRVWWTSVETLLESHRALKRIPSEPWPPPLYGQSK